MLTNKIKVDYNMENIDKDFDIFKVVKDNKDYYKYNILDSAVYKFKAAAVQWKYGTTALVLFRKGTVTESQFKESIMKEYKDVKIQKIDLFDSEECKNCFYYKNRLLAQLLMNSMRTPISEKFMYNNLTGKLFYHNPSWKLKDKKTGNINFIRFLEIVINPGMYLNLEHKTYKKCNNENSSGLYVIDPKTGEFRKKLKSDTGIFVYKEGSLPHNHFRVDNFDIRDYAHFRKSKMGIMEQFLKDVKEKLSNYITIELAEREDAQTFNISNLEKTDISEHEYGEILKKRGVVIVDENNTKKSNDIVNLLEEAFEKYYGVTITTGKLSKEAYNIRIIHNEEFYTENEMTDPHNDNLKEYIVQHITEEAEQFTDIQKSSPAIKKSSPAIKKIVQELIIKSDVREKMISIFDWERLDSKKVWNFVLRKKMKNNENAEHMNFANKKAYSYYNYYKLKIDCNGKMKFDVFNDSGDIENEEWEKICFAYDNIESRNYGVQNQVDGLVYSDIDNIHGILLTKEKTLPNIAALMDTLMKTDGKDKVKKDLLVNAIKDFESNYSEYCDHISKWCDKLSESSEILTKKEIKKILNMRTNAASAFNRFFHKKYDIWIDGELRKEEFESIYQMSNLLNIKYEYNENDYQNEHTFVYYVGAKSKRLSYPNACSIRKVISLGSELEYEELLPLMAVEFVRNSQYTVLPFPYKYLREYMAKY